MISTSAALPLSHLKIILHWPLIRMEWYTFKFPFIFSSRLEGGTCKSISLTTLSALIKGSFLLLSFFNALLPTFMYKTWPDQEGLVNEERMPSPTCSHCPPLQMQISKRMLKRIAQCGPCFIHFVVGCTFFTQYHVT